MGASVQTHPPVLAVLHMPASANGQMWVNLLISEGKRLNFDNFDGVRDCRARLHFFSDVWSYTMVMMKQNGSCMHVFGVLQQWKLLIPNSSV